MEGSNLGFQTWVDRHADTFLRTGFKGVSSMKCTATWGSLRQLGNGHARRSLQRTRAFRPESPKWTRLTSAGKRRTSTPTRSSTLVAEGFGKLRWLGPRIEKPAVSVMVSRNRPGRSRRLYPGSCRAWVNGLHSDHGGYNRLWLDFEHSSVRHSVRE